jgi:hypothetical protein
MLIAKLAAADSFGPENDSVVANIALKKRSNYIKPY